MIHHGVPFRLGIEVVDHLMTISFLVLNDSSIGCTTIRNDHTKDVISSIVFGQTNPGHGKLRHQHQIIDHSTHGQNAPDNCLF